MAVDRGQPILQRVDDIAGLVFLGGTMSVNDGLPWLDDELRLIRLAAAQDVPILGHCLGSQLIAKALGGTVAPMDAKEIGWHPVRRLDNPVARDWLGAVPDSVEVFIWHHEAFSLPPGAVPLLAGEHCADQAYAIGNAVATVGHPEVTADMLSQWLRVYGYDVEPVSASVQAIERIR